MSAITVLRGLGSTIGNPIIEPMLSSEVLIERGRAELDANAHQTTQITLNTVYQESVRLGDLVSVPDPSFANGYKARVTGISIELSNGKASQTLTLERAI